LWRFVDPSVSHIFFIYSGERNCPITCRQVEICCQGVFWFLNPTVSWSSKETAETSQKSLWFSISNSWPKRRNLGAASGYFTIYEDKWLTSLTWFSWNETADGVIKTDPVGTPHSSLSLPWFIFLLPSHPPVLYFSFPSFFVLN
jgi:hypothetical protein